MKKFDNIEVTPVANKSKVSSLIDSSMNQNSSLSLRNATSADPLPIDKDGNLLFFWYDAHEEPSSKGSPEPKVILFGKVKDANTNSFSSISIVIHKLKKTIFLFPKKDNTGKYYDNIEVHKEFDSLRKNNNPNEEVR